MEGQVQQGGGEVRRVHVIYFLSRKGRVEHPHLIRVHHLSRNGVRLRDVKRWLSELRGKDMPESFAWSYKRKYKAGYVWQDLLDEDLITPISDNEYVLKGSEIASTTFNNDKFSYGEKQTSIQKKSTPQEVERAKEEKSSSNEETGKTPESPLGISPKTSCEIEQESPLFGSETSSLTDDSTRRVEKDKQSSTTKQEEEQNGQKDKRENNSDHTDKNNNKEGDNVNSSSPSFKNSSAAPNCSVGKSSGNSGGAKQSNMFRNWITCGAVETNDAVMVINRRNRTSLGVFSNKEKNYKGEIFKGEKLGGSERMAAHSWLLEQHHEAPSARKSLDERAESKKKNNKDEFSERKSISNANKPINRPKCSQCGRQFKPEKLHAHMKSCRGMKAMAKCSTTSCPRTSDKTPLTTQDDSCHQDSASSFYLTNK